MAAAHSLVVQYRLDRWGTEADLARRHRIEELLERALGSTRNGECDGGDIGSGSMNIFLEEVVDPDRARETIVETLRAAGELEGAVIALDLDRENEEGPAYSVLWPEGFSGEFQLL